jgi:hypothetical protein
LPTKATLKFYTGNSTEEVGVTALVKKPMTIESVEKHASLITDEMTIKTMEKYDKTFQKFVGAVDLGGSRARNPAA